MSTPDSHRLYVHFAWCTLARVQAIEPNRRSAIESHLLASCGWLGADPIEVCVCPDRVHLLARLPAVLSVHDFARRMQGDVERFLAETGRVVRWEPGFAAATVTPRDVRRVRKRIAQLSWSAGPVERSRRRRPASSGAR